MATEGVLELSRGEKPVSPQIRHSRTLVEGMPVKITAEMRVAGKQFVAPFFGSPAQMGCAPHP
jgi:hypothetical protein